MEMNLSGARGRLAFSLGVRGGRPGFSPTIAVEEISGDPACHKLTITDVNGTRNVYIYDGEDGNANAGDIVAQLTDPDSYPISNTGGSYTPEIELGGIDRATGENTSAADRVRSSGFIPVTEGVEYTIRNSADVQSCVMFYASDHSFLTSWRSSPYKWVENRGIIEAPEGAAYMRFYTNLTADTGTVFTVSYGSNEVVEFIKQYFTNSTGPYVLECREFDPDMYKLELTRKDDEFTIFTVRAPEDDPKEATISLSNNTSAVSQFVDISSLKYDGAAVKGHIAIVCQTRNNAVMPDFYIAFNDGVAGRVRKLVIEPDAMPVKLTSTGVQFRRNNTFDNNWTSADTVTVDFPALYDDVQSLKARVAALEGAS